MFNSVIPATPADGYADSGFAEVKDFDGIPGTPGGLFLGRDVDLALFPHQAIPVDQDMGAMQPVSLPFDQPEGNGGLVALGQADDFFGRGAGDGLGNLGGDKGGGDVAAEVQFGEKTSSAPPWAARWSQVSILRMAACGSPIKLRVEMAAAVKARMGFSFLGERESIIQP